MKTRVLQLKAQSYYKRYVIPASKRKCISASEVWMEVPGDAGSAYAASQACNYRLLAESVTQACITYMVDECAILTAYVAQESWACRYWCW